MAGLEPAVVFDAARALLAETGLRAMTRLSVTVIAWNEEERLRACLESVAGPTRSWWRTPNRPTRPSSSRGSSPIACGCGRGRASPPRRTSRSIRRPGTGSCRSTPTSVSAPSSPQRIKAIVAADGPADGYLDPAPQHVLGRLGAPRRPLSRLPAPALPPRRRTLRRGCRPRVGPGDRSGRARSASPCSITRTATWRTSSAARTATPRWPPRTGCVGAGDVGVPGLIMKPLGRFLSMYILRRGFLDGWRGLVLAVLYADYVFLRMAKAWEAHRAPAPAVGRGPLVTTGA